VNVAAKIRRVLAIVKNQIAANANVMNHLIVLKIGLAKITIALKNGN
jgi:hypothetical protein